MYESYCQSPFHPPFLGVGLSFEVQVTDGAPATANMCKFTGGEPVRAIRLVLDFCPHTIDSVLSIGLVGQFRTLLCKTSQRGSVMT